MSATAMHFCPLCRSELWVPDAVRTHLTADHKRNAAGADGLIARFDTAKPIPEPEPHMYCAAKSPVAADDRSMAAQRRRECW